MSTSAVFSIIYERNFRKKRKELEMIISKHNCSGNVNGYGTGDGYGNGDGSGSGNGYGYDDRSGKG